MKSRIRPQEAVFLVMLALAAACLICAIRSSTQSTLSKPWKGEFVGEYSFDGAHWQPLTEHSDLSAAGGELYLRGHLSDSLAEGTRLYFYQDHIGVNLWLDGEQLLNDVVLEFHEEGLGLVPGICGSRWNYLISPGITPEDEVVIQLYDPHRRGSDGAFRAFLDTLYHSGRSSEVMQHFLRRFDLPAWYMGAVLLIAALMLLGAALAFGAQGIPAGLSLWKYGLLCGFTGGFVFLDSIGLALLDGLLVARTYGLLLCRILAVCCCGLCLCDALTGRRQQAAQAGVAVSALLNAGLAAAALSGAAVLYDLMPLWALSQWVLCPLLFVCCALELRRPGQKDRAALLAGLVLLAAVLLDLCGVGESIYSHATCWKLAFAASFACYAVRTARHIAAEHRASLRAAELEQELEENRIAARLSQLRPHFVYNVLNSIYYLCGQDPAAAQDAVDKFADYLRNHMAALEQNAPVPFQEEYAHIQTYLSLEQLRFPHTLRVEYDLQTTDFLLPPMTVQILVENAVKHGVTRKRGGGVVTLSTCETPDSYRITVADTGVGFDPEHYMEDGKVHIGLQNVRERLERMSHGTLHITSAPGAGTTAVVTLPKMEETDL